MDQIRPCHSSCILRRLRRKLDMAQPLTCEFEIDNDLGGDLKGTMFGPVTGRLHKNGAVAGGVDPLFVRVSWTVNGVAAPNTLKGRLMFSMAPSAAANQTAASPLKNSGKQLCFVEQDKNVIPGVPPTYRWGPFNIDQTAQLGKYELTFVVEDITTGSPSMGTQWSEDPEFDVDG
jgi:hypothetical protein